MKKNKNDFIEFGKLVINSIHDGVLSTNTMEELYDSWVKNKNRKQLPKDDVNFLPWLQEWYKMFPPIKNGGNKKIQSNFDTCFSKMNTFLSKYKYSYEEIDRATDMYLREMEKDGFRYCRTAYYFINKKDAGSTLLEYCEKLKNNDDQYYTEEETSQYFI